MLQHAAVAPTPLVDPGLDVGKMIATPKDNAQLQGYVISILPHFPNEIWSYSSSTGLLEHK